MGIRGAILAGLLNLVLVLPLGAQEVESSTILTINQDRLFATSLYGERVKAELEVASRALAAENRKIEADLTVEEKSLTVQRPTLPPEKFRILADAFDRKVQGIRRTQEVKTRDLTRRQETARSTYYNLALPVLSDLMREYGAVAILDQRAVFMSSDVIDITEEAVRRIDATLGDGANQPVTPQE